MIYVSKSGNLAGRKMNSNIPSFASKPGISVSAGMFAVFALL
jgi:hypothetical protein